MAIFRSLYTRPGPGVSKSEPKKKGVKRFFELVSLAFWDLIKLNLLFTLFISPSAALFSLGALGYVGVYAYPLSVMAAFPVGGAVASCMFCVAKLLRGEPGYLLYDFWRKLRENALQAAIPGMLYVAFIYMCLYIWASMFFGSMASGYGTVTLLLVSAAFVDMISPYVFTQIAHLELKNPAIIKNSVLLAIKNAPKSFCGMMMGRVIWIVSLILFPLSLWWAPLLLLLGFMLSWLLNLMWIWPGMDSVFAISESIEKGRALSMGGVRTLFSSVEP